MTDDDIIRDATIPVEAKLAGHSKRMDGGLNLRFQIHPNDISPELRDAEIGTRYLLALVQLNDQEEPVVPRTRTTKPEHRLATRAAMLCKNPLFQAFLRDAWSMPNCIDEKTAAHALRTMWGIESRRELTPGSKAAEQFDHLQTAWVAWKEGEEDKEFLRKHEAGKVLTAPKGPVGDFEEGRAELSMKNLPQFQAPEGFVGDFEVGVGTVPYPDPKNAPAATAAPVKGIPDLIKGTPK